MNNFVPSDQEPEVSSLATGPHGRSREELPRDHRADVMAAWLQERMTIQPQVGLILGSGLGNLGTRIEDAERFPFGDIPDWPVSTAVGHEGNLILGHLADVPVVALQGRIHLYEGYSWGDVVRPVKVLARLGIRGLVVSNAAGGLNPQFRCGDLMLISGHLNLMFRAASADGAKHAGVPGALGQARGKGLYHEEWMGQWERLARRENVVLHRGVYAGVSGPNYETRAEYRAFRRLGADAVGMSTVPEVCAAATHGFPVLGISVVTNEAKPDAPTINDANDVIAEAQAAEGRLQRLLHLWLQENRGLGGFR